MDFLPSVIRAEYCGGYRLHLTFNDNSEGTVDFALWLNGTQFISVFLFFAFAAVAPRSLDDSKLNGGRMKG